MIEGKIHDIVYYACMVAFHPTLHDHACMMHPVQMFLPKVGGVDFGYDEAGIVPGGNRESREQTEDNHHKLLRMNNVEEKHRGSGQEECEGYSWRKKKQFGSS